jgi:hypothetical protein
VLGLCRSLNNTAVEERITAWQRARVSRSQQEAEVKDLRAEKQESAALHSQALHDGLARLDTTAQAVCRRRRRGENAGFPR